MARAAKAPKVKRRWSPKMFVYIDSGRGGWDVDSGRSVISTSRNRDKAIRVCRAMNFLEAIERGELIVKEAE